MEDGNTIGSWRITCETFCNSKIIPEQDFKKSFWKVKAIRQGCHRRWSSSKWGWKRCQTEACSYYIVVSVSSSLSRTGERLEVTRHPKSQMREGNREWKKNKKEQNGKCEGKLWWPGNYTWQSPSYINRIWKYFCHIATLEQFSMEAPVIILFFIPLNEACDNWARDKGNLSLLDLQSFSLVDFSLVWLISARKTTLFPN